MADYAIEGGRFLKACKALVTDEFQISWYDRFPAAEHVQAGLATPALNLSSAVGGGPAPAATVAVAASLVLSGGSAPIPADKSNRVKYSCSCVHNVWGKPGLRLQCLECGTQFTPPIEH